MLENIYFWCHTSEHQDKECSRLAFLNFSIIDILDRQILSFGACTVHGSMFDSWDNQKSLQILLNIPWGRGNIVPGFNVIATVPFI